MGLKMVKRNSLLFVFRVGGATDKGSIGFTISINLVSVKGLFDFY